MVETRSAMDQTSSCTGLFQMTWAFPEPFSQQLPFPEPTLNKKKKDSQDCASCQALRESTILNQLPSNIMGSRLNNEGILLEDMLPIQAFIYSLQPDYLRTEFLASAFLKSLELTSTYLASWLTAVPDSL